MKLTFALLLAVLAFSTSAFEAEQPVSIPIKAQGHGDRTPLLQEIPVSKTRTINISLSEIDGKCHLSMGILKKPLDIPAPCDVKTKGAAFGFKPSVDYPVDTDKITETTAITFTVIGGLKFYPSRRTECGESLRVVRIKFKSNKPQSEKLEPYLELSEVVARGQNLGSHCPRQYDGLK